MSTAKVRSDVWTKGITCDLEKSDPNYKKLRFLFFEMDSPILTRDTELIDGVFRVNRIPFLRHRTGNGLHWFGTKLLSIQAWKNAIELLKHLNKKCPMTTLRWKNNKYESEKDLWFSAFIGNYSNNYGDLYSVELSNLLNTTFSIGDPHKFKGNTETKLGFVNYRIKYDTE